MKNPHAFARRDKDLSAGCVPCVRLFELMEVRMLDGHSSDSLMFSL